MPWIDQHSARLLHASLALAMLFCGSLPVAAQMTACAGSLPAAVLDARIDELIQKMTPEERIAQLQDRAPAITRLGIPAYNWWNEGLHGMARNGYATVFPQAIGLAATFNPQLLHAVGEVVSTEARASFNPHAESDSLRYAGLTIWSPNINIFRDPRWGRGQETYGEDPFLTGTLATSFVEGIQAPDGFYLRADATPKHFAAHSGPEKLRDGFNSRTSEHDLNDTYLAAFRQVLTESHAAAMMCAYNAINGEPSCAHSGLLNERVRGQWGFAGYVVSDCDAVGEITDYLHFTADQEHGTALALKAGVDLDCGSSYKHLAGALQAGLITEAEINRSLHRLLLARMRLGMLQPASCSPYAAIPANAVASDAHRELALHAAEQSMVLLRNDKTSSGTPLLPLPLHGKTLAVIGPTAELLSVLQANYHGTAYQPDTLLEGLRKVLPTDVRIVYAQGATLAEGAFVPVPSTAFHGSLKGEYFTNLTFEGAPALVRKDRTVDFDFNRVALAEPADMLAAASSDRPFSVRWQATLTPPAAGDYVLQVGVERCWDCKTHDAYRLLVDDKVVAEYAGGTEAAKDNAVTLHWSDASPHRLQLELRHTGHDEGIRLEWKAPAEALRAEAVRAAQQADVILVLGGLSPDLEGEALPVKIPGFDGGDRTDLGLPSAQKDLLKALEALNKPIVLGITSGSPVATGEAVSDMHAPLALLELWYPGEKGGEALAHLLTGSVSPSGRLPVTVYRSTSDLPAFTDYSMRERGYRYTTAKPEYRFGYGLSYTTFSYTRPELSTALLAAGSEMHAVSAVRNTGTRAADEVVELYLAPPQSEGAPHLALSGIKRIHLKPGEQRRIEFVLKPRQLSTVRVDGQRSVEPGQYKVWIGGAQPEDTGLQPATFEIHDRQPMPE